MRKNFLLISAIPAIVTIFDSCCPNCVISESRQKENLYYVPTAPNTQLLTAKNDLGFALMFSGGQKFAGVECQGAYLPGKHIDVIADYSHAANSDFMKRNQFETGVGYVTQVSKKWHFETDAGLGVGKINNMHATGTSKIDLTHFFIQPTLAVSNEKKTVQIAFVLKFLGENFKPDTVFTDTNPEPFSKSQLQSLYRQPFQIFCEPALLFRFGWKRFLFHTSYSYSADLTNSNLYRSKSNFSFGGSLRLSVSNKRSIRQ